MSPKRVGVLYGGMSQEREVSLRSGKAVAAGLKRSGFDVVEMDADKDLDLKLRQAQVDAVYVALHGRFGEDGVVQGMLEMMGMPYTGSSVGSSAMAMNKAISRLVLAAFGAPVPDGFTLQSDEPISMPKGWDVPVVVKPIDEGSSVGITIVRRMEDFAEAVETAQKYSKRALIEKFIQGTEVTVAVLDGEVLGSLEIEPHREFYNYSAKYDKGGSSHHSPPRIPSKRIDEIHQVGALAYKALECSGAARVDMIVPSQSPAVVLEVNTLPGMTEVSLLPEIAQAAGISFDELVTRIMKGAKLHAGSPVS